MSESFTFTATLWRWAARHDGGPGSWIFLTVPGDISEELRLRAGEPRGFGSVPVLVAAGSTRWETSVFPESDGSFVLPVKKAVREARGVADGDDLTVTLSLRGE